MSLLVDIRKKLKGFSLDVSFSTDGEYLGILGASGSGKSMTLKCIAGVETPDEGRIVLNGKVLYDSERKVNLKPQDRSIGYLFQNYALFPHMTVEENIGIGLKLPENEKKQRVGKMIKSFQLQGLEKKYPNQISGGQQQRVALARCITYKPSMLMLDEPFSALDSYLKEQLQEGVLEMLKLYEGEVLMVTHSIDEVHNFCKNLTVIDKGKSILFGNTKKIFKHPVSHKAARLIGCKNISKCQVVSSHSVYAVDWDITLETEKTSEKIEYIGIQSHDLQIVDSKGKEQSNIIECKINKIVEGVDVYNIFLKNKSSKNNNTSIMYKVNKEHWNKRDTKQELYLKIPKREILLLE